MKKNLRLSVHSSEHLFLRHLFTQRRLALGLSQRALAERLGVLHSFVGKVETGDWRLDVFEFISYCRALEWDAVEVLNQLFSELKISS
ncbi:MAG: helix-turn-helix transcriptional regulator [Neisseria sp.]|nr:helix-turn-helix transcriptional regulator [Neisseria sp.]